MSCSPYDLKDYFFEELPADQRAQVHSHVAGCAGCREELQSLNLTRAALMSAPEEEPPRRIAFVSDRVFEPSWWQRIWSSGPQLGFASAAMLAVAILVHAAMQRPVTPSAAPGVSVNVASVVQSELDKRLQPAIQQAMASESRRTLQLLAAAEARIGQLESRHDAQLAEISDYLEWTRKNESVRMQKALYSSGALQ